MVSLQYVLDVFIKILIFPYITSFNLLFLALYFYMIYNKNVLNLRKDRHGLNQNSFVTLFIIIVTLILLPILTGTLSNIISANYIEAGKEKAP